MRAARGSHGSRPFREAGCLVSHMLFTSFSFMVFFAVVLVASRAIGNWRWRKLFLLAVSYIFYAAWNPPVVILLWISTVTDWHLAARIHRAGTLTSKRVYLALSLLVNLGLLGWFKYGGFLLENFSALCALLGAPVRVAQPSIVLPVGISFYTFQTMSYSMDVYRRRAEPWHDFADYALYVTFFPQLLAGPIVRAPSFLSQCATPKRADLNQMAGGTGLLIVGLFGKLVVADTFCVPVADAVFDGTAMPGLVQAWAGTLAFAVQIFSDFAGYSACAMGTAMCLGFSLPDNFRAPYAAIGFSDFWQRWHISLSSWLRDYLYIPLGGNRRGGRRTIVNLLVTMLLGGLWHGASWMFVAWGGLHSLFLIAEHGLQTSPLARCQIMRSRAVRAGLTLGTFCCVSLAWTFFRAKSMGRAWAVLRGMAGLEGLGRHSDLWLHPHRVLEIAVLTFGVVAGQVLLRESGMRQAAQRIPFALRALAVAVLGYAVVISLAGEDRAFIYFQF